jgi:hypothetical protein
MAAQLIAIDDGPTKAGPILVFGESPPSLSGEPWKATSRLGGEPPKDQSMDQGPSRLDQTGLVAGLITII